MADRADVVVIGAGVGGLAAATRLAACGRRVVVCERRDVTGGKLACLQRDGFSIDIGPSLLTLPNVFEELFRTAGTSLSEHIELVRLDPQFHYHWSDGSSLVVPDGPDATAAAFERLAPDAGEQWRRFEERAGQIWEVATRTFLAGPMGGPWQLARRLRSPADLVAIQPHRTLHDLAAAHFTDARLVQWAGRYATYSGSSPYRAPATLACIAHVEARHGCWYVDGGLDALRTALESVATAAGAEVRLRSEVVRIAAPGGRVAGIELADGTRIDAPVVVANADAEQVHAILLPDRRAQRAVRRAGHSTSGLVIAAGVHGRTPDIGHHNVWFSSDDRAEFAALEAGRMADAPTIYGCVSAVTDPSQAPAGDENWFILVNTPSGIDLDPTVEQDRVLDELATRGVDLRRRVAWSEVLTPADFEARYGAPGGAIYGSSSNGRRAAFLRPANRTRCRGLYLVGGSSHPGGGLPLVAISARIVADLVASDDR